jgi:hypothetical protein
MVKRSKEKAVIQLEGMPMGFRRLLLARVAVIKTFRL